MAKFNEMVKAFRESVGQSHEGIALLLQISPEEYRALEANWIPPDELLKGICALFEWNYNEISRLVSNTPEASTPQQRVVRTAPSTPSTFNEMLINARMEAKQTAEGVALLLDIPLNLYHSYEETSIPSDELLRKICALFGWNYRQIRQMLINQTTPKIAPVQSLLALQETQSKRPKPEIFQPLKTTAIKETLASRLSKARNMIGQSAEAIALLLNIELEEYLAVEEGRQIPNLDLLKRIAALFAWNYKDLQLLIQNKGASQFQPVKFSLQPNQQQQSQTKLKEICQEIEQLWFGIPDDQQKMLLMQLEMIRDRMKQLKALQ
ncbi:hypothetical protein WDW89_09355 [Deltaproteobacteria bacterium TL4]